MQSGVRFVIIGGVAMRMQGSANVTDNEEQGPNAPTARELLSLPKEERAQILRAQAEREGVEYWTDLDCLAAERELTAFTTLDSEMGITRPCVVNCRQTTSSVFLLGSCQRNAPG